METWHKEHGEAINILLFPSDEFGGQELPEAQIPAFVKGKGLPTEGGGCHLMAKVQVNGPEAAPVWQLAKAAVKRARCIEKNSWPRELSNGLEVYKRTAGQGCCP